MSNKCFNIILTRTIIRFILKMYLGGIKMNSVLKQGVIIFLIYILILTYLLFASNRFEGTYGYRRIKEGLKIENGVINISE